MLFAFKMFEIEFEEFFFYDWFKPVIYAHNQKKKNNQTSCGTLVDRNNAFQLIRMFFSIIRKFLREIFADTVIK